MAVCPRPAEPMPPQDDPVQKLRLPVPLGQEAAPGDGRGPRRGCPFEGEVPDWDPLEQESEKELFDLGLGPARRRSYRVDESRCNDPGGAQASGRSGTPCASPP